MNTDIIIARRKLKEVKLEIKEKYGWTTKDYRANIYETKQGLQLSIKLLSIRKGFREICDCIQKKIDIKRGVFSTIPAGKVAEEIIKKEFENGKTSGEINGIKWHIPFTQKRFRPVKNAAAVITNNLYRI